jgi:phosphomannomutase
MTLDPKIFKAYDIRGLTPEQLDEDGAYLIGQAVVRYTDAKTLVVGKDMRDSTPKLFEAFARGANGQGADIVDIGQASTPMFYFAVGLYDLHDAGVMVTASHNPAGYNGFKLCRGDVSPIGGDSGMKEVKEIALAGPYEEQATGNIVTTEIRDAYLDKMFSMVDISRFRDFKMAADCGNGMEGVIIDDLLARLPTVEASVLYKEPDGTFPNHEANPLKEETLDDLKAEVAKMGADLGVAFDGDADRFGLVDEKSEVIRGDILLALLAPKLLADEPGAAVYYDVRCSQVVAEEVEKAGGRAVMAPVGHGLIKPRMRKDEAVFGGELSQHYYFKAMHYAEASDLVMLLVLEMMSVTGKKLSELVAPLMRYHHSGEYNFRVEDKQAVMDALEKKYGPDGLGGAVTKIDGIRVDLPGETDAEGWFFSVRASNTEPLLRLNLEAKSQELMEKHRDELVEAIGGERE